MSRRISRGRFLATMVATLAPMLAACGQPSAPTAPAESKPSATQPSAPTAAAASQSAPKPAASTPASSVQSAGQATSKAPADKPDLVIATPADISKLDPQMSTVVPGHHRQLQHLRQPDVARP